MSLIIDILAPLNSGCMSFAVNNLVDSVDSVAAADPTKLQFTNASGEKTLLKGDNFSILSMGFILSEAFTVWKAAAATPLPSIFLNMKGVTSLNAYKIDALGVENIIHIPMENYETALDLFVDCSKQTQFGIIPITYLNENFTLNTDYTLIKISMAGVPAALNGKTFPITPFIKIAHNYPMI